MERFFCRTGLCPLKKLLLRSISHCPAATFSPKAAPSAAFALVWFANLFRSFTSSRLAELVSASHYTLQTMHDGLPRCEMLKQVQHDGIVCMMDNFEFNIYPTSTLLNKNLTNNSTNLQVLNDRYNLIIKTNRL